MCSTPWHVPGVCDVEVDNARNRTVGRERAEGGARPAVAGGTPALGAGRAALGRASLAEAVSAEADAVLSSLADLPQRADRRPIGRSYSGWHTYGAMVAGAERNGWCSGWIIHRAIGFVAALHDPRATEPRSVGFARIETMATLVWANSLREQTESRSRVEAAGLPAASPIIP